MILILRMTEIIRDYKNFQVDGDEDEPEVGEGGLVGPVVAGGGLAVVLHAVEDVFDHVPPSPGDADGPGAPFPALRPRAGGPVESAAAWLRALVSNRGLFCLATENRTQDTGHAPIPSPDQSAQNPGRWGLRTFSWR